MDIDRNILIRWLTPLWGEIAVDDLVIESAGEGNMNVVLRVIDRSGRSQPDRVIVKQSLPYVRRYPSIAAPVDRIEAERQFYEQTGGTEAGKHMPELLSVIPDDHVMVLEDLGGASDRVDVYGDVRRFPVDEAMRWLNHLHAIEVRNDARCAALLELNAAHMFDIPWDDPPAFDAASVGPELAGVADGLRHGKRIETIRRSVNDLKHWYLCPPGAEAVLCHGDFYPGSWLAVTSHDATAKRETAKKEMAKQNSFRVIDPEFTLRGPREFDVAVAAAHHRLCDGSERLLNSIDAITKNYAQGLDLERTMRMAAAEVTRRLIGVAQLPLTLDDAARAERLAEAGEVLASEPTGEFPDVPGR